MNQKKPPGRAVEARWRGQNGAGAAGRASEGVGHQFEVRIVREGFDGEAQAFGGNQQQAAGTLADLLPGLIDQLTPQGQLPADNGLGDLGALLGGGQGGQGPDLGAIAGALGGFLRR